MFLADIIFSSVLIILPALFPVFEVYPVVSHSLVLIPVGFGSTHLIRSIEED